MRSAIIIASIILSLPFYEKYVKTDDKSTESYVKIICAIAFIYIVFDVIEFLHMVLN